ncbi:MAG: DUF2079 domain-containing protein, partial [Conexivisphaerales archaeon]
MGETKVDLLRYWKFSKVTMKFRTSERVGDFIKLVRLDDLIVFSITVIIAFSYSLFLVTLYNNYNFTVFDLGISYHTEYIFLHTGTLLNWPYSNLLITPSTYAKLVYVLIAPFLLLSNAPSTILIIQATWISFGAFVLYKIAKYETGSKFVSFSLYGIYFLFPGIYGVLPNGGNYVTYLPTFLIISYFFFVRRNYKLSLLFAFLGSMTSPIAPIFTVILIGIEDWKINGITHQLSNRIFRKKATHDGFSRNYYLSLGIFLLAVFVLIGVELATTPSLFSFLYGSGILSTTGNGGGSTISRLISNIQFQGNLKLNFIYDILVGFLFLPVISPYFIPVVIYFIGSTFSTFYPSYAFPNHYNFYFLAFLFLGTIHRLKKITINRKLLMTIGTLIVVAMLFSFLLYSPFSLSSVQGGALGEELTHTKEETYLNVAFSLIPENASVFAQNSFPQLMNRVNFYMPGYYSGQKV